ncbi:MAG: STAS domain-containing protein [Planctomycetota bacterium]|jgi:phospholipid/cholesterol/gamma-HCH transport system permease protein
MASVDYEMLKEGRLRVIMRGSLDTDTTGQLWPEVVRKVAEANPETLAVDAGAVEYCDGAGISLLLELKRRQEQKNGQFQIEGLKPKFSQLMTMFALEKLARPEPKPAAFVGISEDIGKAVVSYGQDLGTLVSFVGACIHWCTPVLCAGETHFCLRKRVVLTPLE